MESPWCFSEEKLRDSPNMRLLQDPDKERIYRIRAINYLQLIGQKLKLSTNCLSIAMVYFHRFYMFHSLKDVDQKELAMVAIFLSAKSQNEFRKLEHIIKVAYAFMDPPITDIDVKSEFYWNKKDFLVGLESVLLQVLGFEVDVELPHPHIIKICQMIEGGKELAKQSYFLATASLMATTLCLQYKPMTVACVCINLSARRSRIEIGSCTEDRPWFYYIVASLKAEFLNELSDELEKSISIAASKVKSSVLDNALKKFVIERPLGIIETNVSENYEKLLTSSTRQSSKKSFCHDSTEIKMSAGFNSVLKEFKIERPLGKTETSASENYEKLPIAVRTPTLLSKRKRLCDDSNEIRVKRPCNDSDEIRVKRPCNDSDEIRVQIPRNFVFIK